jgi:hypothetical protein
MRKQPEIGAGKGLAPYRGRLDTSHKKKFNQNLTGLPTIPLCFFFVFGIIVKLF